jgi:hypothetical protein
MRFVIGMMSVDPQNGLWRLFFVLFLPSCTVFVAVIGTSDDRSKCCGGSYQQDIDDNDEY